MRFERDSRCRQRCRAEEKSTNAGRGQRRPAAALTADVLYQNRVRPEEAREALEEPDTRAARREREALPRNELGGESRSGIDAVH